MKPNKKDKTQLMYKLAMNIIFLIWFFFYSLNYLLSYYEELKTNKETLIEKNNIRDGLVSEGISYSEFKKQLSWVANKNDYWFKILAQIDEDFYDTNIKNWTIDSFDVFFTDKEKQILERESSDEIKSRSNKIDKIIPYYVDGIDILDNNTIDSKLINYVITDFEFINYVEKLLETFSLTTEDPIWINRVEKVVDWTDGSNSLDSSIFYIPLSLTLEWSKKNTLDFLEYLENIWNIEIDDNKDELSVYSDKKFRRVFLWDRYSEDYNIFEKQMISIEWVKFEEYLDRSVKNRWVDEDFIKFIDIEQGREKIAFTVDLRFYVRWISKLQIETKINSVIAKYNALALSLKKKMLEVSKKDFLRKGWEAISIRNNIRTYVNDIESKSEFFKKDIKLLRKDTDKIYDLYKTMLLHEENFNLIEKKIELIDEKIKTL